MMPESRIAEILNDALDSCRELINKNHVTHQWKKLSIKGQGETVTNLDIEIEALLSNCVKSSLPEATIFGEENHHDVSALEKEYCFIIDPIDGTTNFISGSPDFSISIGMAQNHQIKLGVLDFPARNQRLWARYMQGARDEKGHLQVSRQDDVHKLRIAVSPSLLKNAFWAHIKKELPNVDFIAMGALTPKVSAVATGEVDAAFYLSGINQSFVVWDFAAAGLILEESGGQFTSLDGRSIMSELPVHSNNGWLASNSLCHDSLLVVINEGLKQIEDR
jgi:myo-inositol-1(or 4)-monophosphatase